MTIRKLLMRTMSSEFPMILGKKTLCNISLNSKSINKMAYENPAVNDTISKLKENPLSIEWENVIKSIPGKSENATKLLLKSIYTMKDVQIATSYYKYMKRRGETLSELNLYLLINALSNCRKEDLVKYEDTIQTLFNECKNIINKKYLCTKPVLKLFALFPSCFKEILSLMRDNELTNIECLIESAFAFDKIDIVWEILEKTAQPNEDVLSAFINYCLRKAIFNEFSIDDFYKFFDIYSRKGFILHSQNMFCHLQPLISVLNHCQNDFHWSVRDSSINLQMKCHNCKSTLNDVTLTEEEFDKLKNAVYKILLCGEDLFLKTTQAELNNFVHFLRNCQPYNLVIDGLNLFYRRGLGNDNTILNVIRSYANENKMNVLVVARKHFKQFHIFQNFPNVQFFLTQNLSDDDLFVIYAAMTAGWGTHIVTSDFLNTHASKFDRDLRLLFLKWQFNHQLIADRKFGIVVPNRHCALPQCTVSPQNGGNCYIWHLSYAKKYTSFHTFNYKFDWVCLKAIPKNLLKFNKINKNKKNSSQIL